ncbi:MAG: DUF3181 family protein [Pseudanabaenaceae cyanobacterium]
MITSEQVEQLAGAIAEEIYIDVAKWHLYLGDAKLAVPIAEKLAVQSQKLTMAQLKELLAEFRVGIGGGKSSLPLIDFIPEGGLQKLLEISHQFLRDD